MTFKVGDRVSFNDKDDKDIYIVKTLDNKGQVLIIVPERDPTEECAAWEGYWADHLLYLRGTLKEELRWGLLEKITVLDKKNEAIYKKVRRVSLATSLKTKDAPSVPQGEVTNLATILHSIQTGTSSAMPAATGRTEPTPRSFDQWWLGTLA